MKKILHLLTSNKFAGAEKMACNIINVSNKSYDIVYCSLDGPIKEQVEENGIKFLGLEKVDKKSVQKVIDRYKPDIIHSHDYTASVLVAMCKFRGEIISHIHHTPPFAKKISLKSIVYLISTIRYKCIVSVSKSIMEETIFYNKICNKVRVIENYVDSNEVKSKSLQKHGDIEKIDLIYIGRLKEYKNPIKFIKIVKGITEYIDDISAVIIGEGPLLNKCNELIASLKLERNIKVVGFLNNPFPIINNSKIIVVPSEREGFGLVAVEGMILGKPIIASNVGGLKEVVDNCCGLLCNEEEEYINEIIKLLTDKKIYSIKSKEALKKAKKYTDIYKFSRNILGLYGGDNKRRIENG